MAGTITVDSLVAELGYTIDSKDLEKFKEGTDSAGTASIAMGNLVAKAGEKIAEAGIQAAKAAVVFVKDLVTGFVDAGDEIGKVSRQIGVSSRDLQGLRFAAERSGVSIKSMEKGLKLLQVGLFDAKTKGTGPFAEGIEALGLSITTLEGLTTTEQLAVFADALNEVGDEAEKTGIAAKLFGARAGPELKTLLEGGSEGIRALTERADELGGIIPEEGIANAERLADSFTDLKTIGVGAANTLGGAMAPAVDEMTQATIEWVQENREFIDQELPELIRDGADAARELVPRLVSLAKTTASLVQTVVDLEEKTGVLSRTMSILSMPIDIVTAALQLMRDVGFQVADFILKLAETIPGLTDSAKDLRATLALFKDTDVTVGVTEKTEKQIKAGAKAFKDQADLDKKQAVIGGLALPTQRRKRSRSVVLAEKLENKEKLSRSERKEARSLGLDLPRGKGGKGKKGKPKTILGQLGLDDGSAVSGAPSGGGASPLAGASFVSIDASLTVNLGGIAVSSETIEEGVREAVRGSTIWGEIADHFNEQLPGLG